MSPPGSRTASGSCSSTTSAPAHRTPRPTTPSGTASLAGYADDVLAICEALDLRDVIFVGHSVSAMIGVLAAQREPDRFAKLVLVGPSPRYIDDGDYVGGFTEADIAELLDSLESNYLGWSTAMAPVIMGNPDRPELGEELTASFCRPIPTSPAASPASPSSPTTAPTSPGSTVPTLVLQCRDDVIAPVAVGEYVRDAIPDSTYVLLEATGHCPQPQRPRRDRERHRRLRRWLSRTVHPGPGDDDALEDFYGALLDDDARGALRAGTVRLPLHHARRHDRQGQPDLPHPGPATTATTSSAAGRSPTCSPSAAASTTRPTTPPCSRCRAAPGRSPSTSSVPTAAASPRWSTPYWNAPPTAPPR